MISAATVADCTIRDAEDDEAEFFDLVVDQAGLPVPGDRTNAAWRVATRCGQVVGFASVTVDDGLARLDYVYVHHHARRSGVGRALVADSRRRTEVLRIEAHPAAETFFRRIGARQEGALPPDDGHPFCRPLFAYR